MRDNTPNDAACEVIRPWTPITATLRDRVAAMPAGTHKIRAIREENERQQRAEHDLIALAPEMAEAILAWDDLTQYGEAVEHMNPCYALLAGLADKLRAIGAKCIDGSCCDDEGCRARLGEDAHA